VEIKVEKLVEIIVEEVVRELSKKGILIMPVNRQKSNSCSCKVEKVNPSNCRTSDLSEKYLISIKAEINDCLAL
jgi:protein-L-isoaspartate O-methyltransferase